MRALVMLILLGGAGYGAFVAYERLMPRPTVATPTPTPVKASPTVIEQCRDDCEQRAILYHHPDSVLRLCRATCDAQAPQRPYEPIRSVTRAPADHRPGKIVPSTAK